ncbi:MAG TPA: anti-sigma factor [Tepidisphaeraceae bacterium]|nr:anti-sigma factor [Tepidisphaeraceae bacterium]
METCAYSSQLSAYYDGELSGKQLAEVEQHIAACPTCQSELAQMRSLSSLIAAAPQARMPAYVRQDLYALAPAAGEGVYLRIGEWVTALAASVILAVAGWMFYHQASSSQISDQAVATNTWSPIAVDPPKPADLNEVPDDPKLIDWVTTNVAAGQNP